MDGIVTPVYCKDLTHFRLGLVGSPGSNERVYVITNWDVAGRE
jgi:hypothetical protein